MLETLTQCPICGHTEAQLFTEAQDFTVSQEIFKIVQCQECTFCYTNPRPDFKSIAKYYDSEAYISHSNTKKGLTSRLYQWVRQSALKEKSQLVARLSDFHPEKQLKILDYGCGTGEFLNTCRKEGWRIDGVEPNQAARQQAEKLTGLFIQEDLFSEHFTTESYSVITLWHVLEHVHALQETLERLKSLLCPEGILLLALPNRKTWEAQKFGSYWAAYDVPRHLYHFSPTDVANLAKKHHFEIQEMLPMYYDAYYVSLLSEKYKSQKTNFFKGFWQGWQSNQHAKKTNQYSSLIYVLKKKAQS